MHRFVLEKKEKYHLGYFENIDDAVDARKAAEQVLYRNLLDHYEKDLKENVETEVARKRKKH